MGDTCIYENIVTAYSKWLMLIALATIQYFVFVKFSTSDFVKHLYKKW